MPEQRIRSRVIRLTCDELMELTMPWYDERTSQPEINGP